MDRRQALARLARGGGLGALALLAPDELLALGARWHERAAAGGAGVLTAAQRATAGVAMDAIIPRTDTPGATDVGTVAFLDVMLGGWFAPAERDRVVAGLDALEARARAAHRASFAALGDAPRLALLEALDAEVQAARRGPATRALGDAIATHWFAAFRVVTVLGWATSRPAMERSLGSWPLPGRYDADAPVTPRRARGRAAAAPHAHAPRGDDR